MDELLNRLIEYRIKLFKAQLTLMCDDYFDEIVF